VPGYESVGRVISADPGSLLADKRVFVPGAHSFDAVRSLFGGAASRLVAPESKVYPIGDLPTDEALMLSLAATAYHAMDEGEAPDLVVGFGALGRLLFRLTVAMGHPAPQVWETNPARQRAEGISAITADKDPSRDYRQIYDASGNRAVIDKLVGAVAHGGTIVLAGFYPGEVGFAFAPAFQKEARFRIAAEWRPSDLEAVLKLVAKRKLSLSGLVSHSHPWTEAKEAYRTAFTDPDCFKMTLDWETA
jgi:3-hydroxyethyl bacteriochlorophyllide a dehydrogenase